MFSWTCAQVKEKREMEPVMDLAPVVMEVMAVMWHQGW